MNPSFQPARDPRKSLRPVRLWLYIVAFMVVAIVLVGGATRLTDSGLSITQWQPVSGIIPPMNAQDWASEFAKYQTTTEFQTINRTMTLDQFKVIFWWEWGHRFLARMVGFMVLFPMIWFWITSRLPKWLKPALLLLLALGGLQGFIGWWMVKSGLVNRVDVSQLRLAVHLTMACVILTMTLWLARSIAPHSSRGAQGFSPQGFLIVATILAQIFLGGLVAGLDAGMAYNTWPLMNGSFVPDGLFAIFPVWKNFVDNALTVQFVHRIGAYILWAIALVHAVALQAAHPSSPHSRRGWFLLVLVTLQAFVGIFTLLLQVPLAWALLHQLGAILVLGFAVAHWRALNPREEEASQEDFVALDPQHGRA